MNKPDVFQKSSALWYKKYIEETKKWVSEHARDLKNYTYLKNN